MWELFLLFFMSSFLNVLGLQEQSLLIISITIILNFLFLFFE